MAAAMLLGLSVTAMAAPAHALDVTCWDYSYEPDEEPAKAHTVTVDGGSYNRAFCSQDDYDWYKFEAVAGTRYRLAAWNMQDAMAVVQVYDANIKYIDGGMHDTYNDPYSQGAFVEFTPTRSGTYYASVGDYRGMWGVDGDGFHYSFGITSHVNTDFTPPTATPHDPSPGATEVPLDSWVHTSTSEHVVGVDHTTFTLYNDSAGYQVDGNTQGNEGNEWMFFPFQPLTPGTRYTATLIGGPDAIRDRGGNPLARTTWSFTTAGEYVPPPVVTSRSPADGAVGVSPTTNVTATFDKPVEGVDKGTFYLREAGSETDIAATVSQVGTTNEYVLDPTPTLASNTVYEATLVGCPWCISETSETDIGLVTTSWRFTTSGGDITPPTVTGRTPAVDATGVGGTSNVTATFDETVSGVSGSTFTLRNASTGAAVSSAVSQNGTTNQWILNPGVTLSAGTRYTATLTGGASAIRDAASNALASTSWSFTTAAAAGTPPIVKARAPKVDATNVSRTANITATFNEAVNGVSASTFTVSNTATGATVAGVISRNGTTNQWIFNPNVSLANDTRYTVMLTGGSSAIRDLAGTPLATTGWTFLTGPKPTVKAKSPASSATGVSRAANVTATFSEVVDGVSGTTFTLKNASTGVVVSGVVSRNGTTNQWILNPGVTLGANTRYTATLTGGTTATRDVAGNPLTTTSWSFTTAA